MLDIRYLIPQNFMTGNVTSGLRSQIELFGLYIILVCDAFLGAIYVLISVVVVLKTLVLHRLSNATRFAMTFFLQSFLFS